MNARGFQPPGAHKVHGYHNCNTVNGNTPSRSWQVRPGDEAGHGAGAGAGRRGDRTGVEARARAGARTGVGTSTGGHGALRGTTTVTRSPCGRCGAKESVAPPAVSSARVIDRPSPEPETF